MDDRKICANYRREALDYSSIRWWKCKRNWKAMDRMCKIREKLILCRKEVRNLWQYGNFIVIK